MRHAAPILIALACAAAHAEPPAEQAEPKPPVEPAPPAAVDAETVAAIVAELGDDDYRTRQRAQQRLEAMPAEAIALVLPHYRQTEDAEVRMRLERYGRAYFEGHVFPAHAGRMGWPTFLGIAMTPHEKGGVLIERVIAGSAAERAGLKVGDRLVGLQGRRLPVGDVTRDISETIRAIPAGRPLRLTVEREGAALEVAATLKPASEDELRNLDQVGAEEIDRLIAARRALKRRWWEQAFLKGRADLPAEDGAAEKPAEAR